MIRVTCGSCEEQLWVRERHRGRVGVCPACGAKLVIGEDGVDTIPREESAAEKILSRQGSNQGSLEFSCGHCGRELKIRQRHLGRSGSCPGCGATVRLTEEGLETEPPSEEEIARVVARRKRRIVSRRRRLLAALVIVLVAAALLLVPRLWPEETRRVDVSGPDGRAVLAALLEGERPTLDGPAEYSGYLNHVSSVVVIRVRLAPESGSEAEKPGSSLPSIVLSGFDVYIAIHSDPPRPGMWGRLQTELQQLGAELDDDDLRRSVNFRRRIAERRESLEEAFDDLCPDRVAYVKFSSVVLESDRYADLRRRYEPEARSMIPGGSGQFRKVGRGGRTNALADAKADLAHYEALRFEGVFEETTVRGVPWDAPEWLLRRVREGKPDAEIAAVIVAE